MTAPHRTNTKSLAEKIATWLEECRGIAEPLLVLLMSTFLGIWLASIGRGLRGLGHLWALIVAIPFAIIWYWGHRRWLNPRYSKLLEQNRVLSREIADTEQKHSETLDRLQTELNSARMGLQGSLKSLL